MKIGIRWFTGKNPQFNIELTGSGSEPFLTVRGCRLVNGSNGEFISYPAAKGQDGKYWNHAIGSDAFNAEVLKVAKREMPQRQQARDDVDSDAPF